MKPGTQIVYVPSHALGNLAHPDCEFGFVTSVKHKEGTCFCRYWRKHEPGNLRTRANSESTRMEDLQELESVPQFVVDGLLWLIEKGYL
jgi:hypothetical protein